MEIQAFISIDRNGKLNCSTALKSDFELLYNIDIEKEAHLLKLADTAIQSAIDNLNDRLTETPEEAN